MYPYQLNLLSFFKPLVMLKRIIFSFSFLFLVFSVEAQETDVNSGTTFGVFAGVGNINHVSDALFPYNLPKNPGVGESYLVGIFLDVPLGESLFFKPELNYFISNKSTGYLEVAPLLKYYLLDTDFSILAGPQARIITTELADNYKRAGFELAGGLSYDLGKRWVIEAKYAYELTNRYKEGYQYTGGADLHFETWSVGVGFKF